MANDCVLDAHSLLWFFEGNPKLGRDARSLLADVDNRLIIPAIALAEGCWVAEKGRSKIPSARDLLDVIDSDSRMSVDAVDSDLVERSTRLTSIGEMHDRLIVATVLRQRERSGTALLLSADAKIRASGLIDTRW